MAKMQAAKRSTWLVLTPEERTQIHRPGVEPSAKSDAEEPWLILTPESRLARTSPQPAHTDGPGIGLLDLPSELRNEIYDYLYQPDSLYVDGLRWHWWHKDAYCVFPYCRPRCGRLSTGISNALPLLRTCRIVHQEASSVLYDNVTFRFNPPQAIDNFHKAMATPRARYFRHVEIVTNQSDPWLTIRSALELIVGKMGELQNRSLPAQSLLTCEQGLYKFEILGREGYNIHFRLEGPSGWRYHNCKPRKAINRQLISQVEDRARCLRESSKSPTVFELTAPHPALTPRYQPIRRSSKTSERLRKSPRAQALGRDEYFPHVSTDDNAQALAIGFDVSVATWDRCR